MTLFGAKVKDRARLLFITLLFVNMLFLGNKNTPTVWQWLVPQLIMDTYLLRGYLGYFASFSMFRLTKIYGKFIKSRFSFNKIPVWLCRRRRPY